MEVIGLVRRSWISWVGMGPMQGQTLTAHRSSRQMVSRAKQLFLHSQGKAPDESLCIQHPGNSGDCKSCRIVCLRPGVQDPNLHTEQPGESGPLLSKLPAPKKKRRPVLLTALARPIPDSESDVRSSSSLMSVCP